MKRSKKSVFWIVSVLIILFTVSSIVGISSTYGDKRTVYIKGVSDIRWGIDIRGGVDAVFSPPEGVNATPTQMAAAEAVVRQRLLNQNITDSEVYTDKANDRIIVRFPWKVEEKDFNPENAIKELGETAELTFREGNEMDPQTGAPIKTTLNSVILVGKDIKSAAAKVDNNTQSKNYGKYYVSLELTPDGAKKFSDATGRLLNKVISIWMDQTMVSYPTVENQITDGNAMITGNFTAAEAKALADKINSGALPFKLETQNFSTISPTLGSGARDAMMLAVAIAFGIVCLYIIFLYRLPGIVACIALLGQVAGTIAAVSGFFAPIPSFTLTLPGMAGIILAVGMGVDANIITTERIKEEIQAGKTIEGAVNIGFQKAFTAIFDGNITMILIAIILMGAFGPPNGIFAKLLTPFFFMFGSTTTGEIYSFGYTLMIGVLLNFVMGVTASRLMLKSLARYKSLRKVSYYCKKGAEQND